MGEHESIRCKVFVVGDLRSMVDTRNGGTRRSSAADAGVGVDCFGW